MNILNLPGWSVLATEESDHDYKFIVEYRSTRTVCSNCGSINDSYGHGKLSQLIMDLPIHAKRVGLEVQRKRFQCRTCKKTFMQELPDVDETRWATNRLIAYIESQSIKRTFTSIADDVGVDEKTVRNIFRTFVARVAATIEFTTPEWLGIDELTLLRKPRCIFTNVRERTIVELLETRNKPAVAAFLHKLPDKEQVQLVTIDMWNPYREAVREALPHADIVVDKFHIVRMANVCLEDVRKYLRGSLPARQRRTLMHDRFILLRRRRDLEPKDLLKLAAWTGAFPDLALAYELKEQFFDIWEASSRHEAEQRYEVWLTQIPDSMRPYFQPLITAMSNWHIEIFNYFDHDKATNAYTEAVNGIAKIINKVGRGYSFEAIRAKLLYGNGLKKQARPKYQKTRKTKNLSELGLLSSVQYMSRVEFTSLGNELSTLVQHLESELE